MAKQIIAHWNEVQLPALVIHAECETGFGRRHRAEESLAGERFAVRAGEIEVALGSLRTDVLLHDPCGRRLAVEVRVTHAVDEAKRSLVARLDVAMVEYDLSPLPRDGIDEPTLAADLAVMAPQWIHHPQAGEVRRRLEGVLRQALEEEDQDSRKKLDQPAGTVLALIPQEEGFKTPLAEAVELDRCEAPSHCDSVEMDFDPSLGLFQRGKPPKPPRRLADFTLMGVEVRIRSHELLDAVAVWACDSRSELQQRVLQVLAADGCTAGVTCSTHALYLGYFLAWGSEASQWVRELPGRVAMLE